MMDPGAQVTIKEFDVYISNGEPDTVGVSQATLDHIYYEMLQ